MAGVGTMDNNTKFKVGDRVWARQAWSLGGPIGTVQCVWRDSAWVLFAPAGRPSTWAFDELEPVVTFPERWINVYGNGYASGGYTSRGYSDEASADWESIHPRIGVIHLHSDGTLTMEAP